MISRFFKKDRSNASQPGMDFVTIVSGLPRSGTSMMMRMLDAGGLPVVTDSLRMPDESNPKGYYEFEPVKKMTSGENTWVASCRGKAVKIVSPLLQRLPTEYAYRVIFMQRNLNEILASQREMLARRGEAVDMADDQSMQALYQKHLAEVSNWIGAQNNMQALYLHYNQILENPTPQITRLAQFLQPHRLDHVKMSAVIESALYRQRNPQVGQPVQQG